MTKTKSLKKKIEVTREEWQQAEGRWYNTYKKGTYQTRELNERQLGLQVQIQKNIKSLNGTAIIILRDSDGNIYQQYCYRGMILKTQETNNQYVFTVLLYPSDNEDWDGERIEEVYLYQIEQAQDIFLPGEAEIKEMKFLQIINIINRSRKKNLIDLETKRKDYLRAIDSKEKDILNYKNNVAFLETQIKINQIPDLSKEEITKFFRYLGKNKKINNAYINMAGEMVIETKMLYATTPVKMIENKKKPVGRFIFKLSTNGMSACSFANLDYCYHNPGSPSHYPHPNISSQAICTGNNSGMLNGLVQAGQFYELTDFLLIFFSLFPHDSGGPHVRHETWIASRKPEPKANPFESPPSERLWELYPGKMTDPPRSIAEYPEAKFEDLTKFVERQEINSTEQAVTYQSIQAQLRERMNVSINAGLPLDMTLRGPITISTPEENQ